MHAYSAAGAVVTAGFVTTSAGFASDLSLSAAGLLGFLSLKSEAYQPVPLNWKLGADNILENVSLLQFGQIMVLASLILRINSSLWPQLVHWKS